LIKLSPVVTASPLIHAHAQRVGSDIRTLDSARIGILLFEKSDAAALLHDLFAEDE
jgi:hypothetical protein